MVVNWEKKRRRRLTELEQKILAERPGEPAFNAGSGDLPVIGSLMSLVMLARGNSFSSEEGFWREYRRASAMVDDTSPYYRHYPIPKANGRGYREIYTVDDGLRVYQEAIRGTILDPLDEKYSSKYAYAYRRGRSVRDNAAVHAGHGYIVKLDIKDFFDSTGKSDVYRMFSRYTNYSRAAKTVLTALVCRDGHLSQGSCTSPQIANLVMVDLDGELAAYCEPQKITYSRYCDDMTFSSDEPFDHEALIRFVSLRLRQMHYRLNCRKTKVLGPDSRHIVTGIVVNNERIRVIKKYKKKLRQEIYYIRRYGITSHLKRIRPGEYTPVFEGAGSKHEIHYLAHLLGQAAYALYIDPDDEELRAMVDYLKQAVTECVASTGTRRSEYLSVISRQILNNRMCSVNDRLKIRVSCQYDEIVVTASFRLIDDPDVREVADHYTKYSRVQRRCRGRFVKPGRGTGRGTESTTESTTATATGGDGIICYEVVIPERDFSRYNEAVPEVMDDITWIYSDFMKYKLI